MVFLKSASKGTFSSVLIEPSFPVLFILLDISLKVVGFQTPLCTCISLPCLWSIHDKDIRHYMSSQSRKKWREGGKNEFRTHSRTEQSLENQFNAKTYSRNITRSAKHYVHGGHYILPGVQKFLLLKVPSHKGYQQWAEQNDKGSKQFLTGISSCSS